MTRERIAAALRAAVDVPWIDAAWVGGSEAFGRNDAWSDVDLQLLLDPDRHAEAFALVEACLEALGGIDAVYESDPFPDFAQRFYRVVGAPEWCMVDLALMRPERLAPWLDPDRHGRPVVWFDRRGALVPTRDPSLEERFAVRRSRLLARVDLHGHLPGKELARGRVVEAVDAYHRHLLTPLVELLRAEHCPRRQDFGRRYVELDLPAEVVARLERLSLVGSTAELAERIAEARAWIVALAPGLRAPRRTGRPPRPT